MRFLLKVPAWTALLTSTFVLGANPASSLDPFCQQFGAEAVVTTSKVFVTTLPASTFVSQAKTLRGCVIRRKHWNELRRKLLITPNQERDCIKSKNAFAYIQDANGEITTFCVEHIYP